MLLFFANLGACASFREMLQASTAVFAFIAALIAIHFAVIYYLSKAFGVSTPVIMVASNANCGGPATACAMAAAKKWTHLIQPAMLVGSLGYAVGTVVGLAVANLLKLY